VKATLELYGQFLLSSQINYTCTFLADHLEGLTHDNVLPIARATPFKLFRVLISTNRTDYIITNDISARAAPSKLN
jgi:hypothetical protein